MKNDTSLCACAVMITLGRKNVGKRHLASSNLTCFINCARQKWFLQNERRRTDLQKIALDLLIFASGLSYDLSSLVMILPVFSTLKDHT